MHALFLLCQTDFKIFVISFFSNEQYCKKAASRKERVKQARMKVTQKNKSYVNIIFGTYLG